MGEISLKQKVCELILEVEKYLASGEAELALISLIATHRILSEATENTRVEADWIEAAEEYNSRSEMFVDELITRGMEFPGETRKYILRPLAPKMLSKGFDYDTIMSEDS